MSYTRVNWNSTTTYVSADNLNIMDKGIKDLDTNIGDVTTLTTTAKTVVPAIKELKTGLEALNNNFINMHEYQKFMFKYIDISSTDGLDSGTNLYYKDIDLTQYLVGGTAIIASFACNAYIPAGVDKYIVASGILSNADKIIRVYFNKQITSAFSLSVFCIYK